MRPEDPRNHFTTVEDQYEPAILDSRANRRAIHALLNVAARSDQKQVRPRGRDRLG
jgi:hypothetical protein